MYRKSVMLGLIILVISVFAWFSVNSASEFAVNTNRQDPYKQFKFRVKWDGRYVPGILRVNGLHRDTQVIELRDGGASGTTRRVPGKTTYEPIVLERGRTHDTAFEQWANKVWNLQAAPGNPPSPSDYRKDIIIELYNEAGQLTMAFRVYGCWPSKYSPIQSLDADSNDLAIESMVLEHDGFERDYDIYEPTEQSFTIPQ